MTTLSDRRLKMKRILWKKNQEKSTNLNLIKTSLIYVWFVLNLSDHPSLVQRSCLKNRFGWMKQSFNENIRPGVKLELITKHVQNAVGLSSFYSLDFVLFWANLDLVEFWLKSEKKWRFYIFWYVSIFWETES